MLIPKIRAIWYREAQLRKYRTPNLDIGWGRLLGEFSINLTEKCVRGARGKAWLVEYIVRKRGALMPPAIFKDQVAAFL